MPAESEAGDADIILSDVPGGCTLTAHSLYLSHASPVFREALTASAQSLREASDEPDTKPKPAGKRRKTGEAKPDVASLKPARPVLTLADTTRYQDIPRKETPPASINFVSSGTTGALCRTGYLCYELDYLCHAAEWSPCIADSKRSYFSTFCTPWPGRAGYRACCRTRS